MILPYADAFTAWLESAQELAKPPKGVALPLWPKFNEYLGTMRPHELTLLCAPTGAGKTALLASLSSQLLTLSIPHFVAPVETGHHDFTNRVMSCLGKTDLNHGGLIQKEVLQKIHEQCSPTLGRGNLKIGTYDNRVEVADMINMLKYQHQEYGCRVALLDNLNFFLRVVSSQNEKLEMDNTVHEFVMLSKYLPMHILLIVHPRKTDGGRVLSEFDIKGSSTAVQEAANVILFNRPSEEQIKQGHYPTDRELVFRKIRKRGAYVGKPIWLTYIHNQYFEVENHEHQPSHRIPK